MSRSTTAMPSVSRMWRLATASPSTGHNGAQRSTEAIGVSPRQASWVTASSCDRIPRCTPLSTRRATTSVCPRVDDEAWTGMPGAMTSRKAPSVTYRSSCPTIYPGSVETACFATWMLGAIAFDSARPGAGSRATLGTLASGSGDTDSLMATTGPNGGYVLSRSGGGRGSRSP